MDLGSQNITLRFAIVIVIGLVLLIPLLLVSELVNERWRFHREAYADIAQSWASKQELAGPIIAVPVEPRNPRARISYLGFMPAELKVNVSHKVSYRKRGIFNVPVLDLDVELTGRFELPDRDFLTSRYGNLRYEHATVYVQISDVRGIKDASLVLDETEVELESGTSLSRVPMVSAPLSSFTDAPIPFTFRAKLRATQRVAVVPIADQTQIAMDGDWPHPSFDGRILPDSHDVDSTGFTANWQVDGLSRGQGSIVLLGTTRNIYFGGRTLSEADMMDSGESIYTAPRPEDAAGSVDRSAEFSDAETEYALMSFGTIYVPENSLGYSLADPVSLYQTITRSTKYGILFIGLTLIAFLCLELVTNTRFHFVQYGVIGLGLIIFYLVLLSLAEHIGFDWGYVIGAAILTLMMTIYTFFASRNRMITLTVYVLLVVLYAVLYTILHLEIYSLMVGTALLLVVLGAIMWATRNITEVRNDSEPSSASGE